MELPKKRESLKKMALIELKETLEREENLLKNIRLINKLKDKGESIRQFRDQVKNEIEYRKGLDDIQSSIGKLSISDQETHAQKLCEFEKSPAKERYKPFSTLNKTMKINPDSKIYKIVEDCKPYVKPTKLIPLPESMDILKKQEDRVKEEMVKIHFNRLLIQEGEDDCSSSDSEKSTEPDENE
ncbi:unnamed protein product [Phaedon cochleariae]|uniref:Uncharacterized protein n=1 Tax=Phaedon cochleariae TaxID=80249 RepID=A0A9N9SBM4_PHACE|nr:unnamed protein product [Phaedon cochleariae]